MTRQGTVLLTVLVAGGLGGLVLGWPEIALCTAGVLTVQLLFLVPLVWMHDVQIRSTVPRTDFARGDEAELTLRTSRVRSKSLVVRMAGSSQRHAVVIKGGEYAASIELDSSSRGCFSLGPFALSKSDIFGTWEKRIATVPAVTYWVTPRVSGSAGGNRLLELVTLEARNNPMSTVDPADEFGEYQVGDEYRLINWKMTARTGNLMVRKLRPQKQRLGLFVDPDIAAWNTSERFENSNGEANYETAVDYAFGLAVHLMKARREFDFLSTDPSLAPLRGPSNERGLLRWGAEVRGAGDLSVARTHLLQGVRELGVTTVIGVTPGRGCRLISEADLFPLSCTLMLAHPPTVTTPAK